MKKAVQFFKRYWIFIVLAMAAGGLLLIRLIQKSQAPLPETQPSPVSQITLSPPKISGTTIPLNSKTAFIDFSFPSRLKTYQGQEIELSPDKAKKIAREFDFSGSPQINEDVLLGTFYAWSSKTNFLSIALKINKIDFGQILEFTAVPKQGDLSSPEEVKRNLENLLDKLELKPEFEFKWQKEKYLSEGFYLQPAQPEQADFIMLGTNPAIGQYQLVGSDPTNPLVSLILNKNKEILRFRYQVHFSGFDSLETYDLKTKEEVESMLLSEGRIVYFGTFQKSVRPPEITQAEFNQITLAYYQDPEKNPIIQPIYILSGQGTLENGEKTEIIAYLPAIRFGTPLPEREFFELPEIP